MSIHTFPGSKKLVLPFFIQLISANQKCLLCHTSGITHTYRYTIESSFSSETMPLLKQHDDGCSGGGSWALSAVTSLTWPATSRKYFIWDAHLLVSFCQKVLTLDLHPFASSIVNEQDCQSSLVSHSGKSSFWDCSILVWCFSDTGWE